MSPGNKEASRPLKLAARSIDTSIILIILSVVVKLTAMSPTPNLNLLTIVLSIIGIYWIPQKILTGASIGERLWMLAPPKRNRYRLREKLFLKAKISNQSVFLGSLCVTLSALLALSSINETIFKHPLWSHPQRWNLQTLYPPPAGTVTTPFFYATGGWPIDIDKTPITFSLEYKKGPPHHFISHIKAQWPDSNISLIIEGPKTPKDAGTQDKLKSCFTNRLTYSCLASKELTLDRHLSEIRNALHSNWPEEWTVKWFQVDNPTIPPEEQSQGIYLSALSSNHIQDRFILVNRDGVQQTLIFNRKNDRKGELAFENVVQIVRGIRVYNELNTSRTWINQLLEGIRLDSIKQTNSLGELSSRLNRIQLLLLSRISVYPQHIDSYYHLAGTSTIILNKKLSSPALRDTAIKNIESAYRYSSDISPNDPRVQQILSLWQNSLKQ